MKKSFSSFIAFIFILSLFCFCEKTFAMPRKVARGQEAWRALKKAQDALSDGEFGEAVQFAEQSKNIRKQDIEWKSYVLENTLKKVEVRRAGDSVANVIPVLKELEQFEAVSIIEEYLQKNNCDGSYAKLREFIASFMQYPEADYLLGKIYRMEGEFETAYKYMRSAFDNRNILDVPMEKYDLLYDLAQLAGYLNLSDEESLEKYLLVIVSDDARHKERSYVSSMLRIIKNDKQDSVEKFFLMYRCRNDVGLKAFCELGKFYAEVGQKEKALEYSSYAGIVAVSKIESVLKQKTNGFEYTNFEDFLNACAKYEDVVTWGNKNNIWELFVNIAENAENEGKTTFAKTLLEVLSRAEPEKYWRQYAERKLESLK